jgi:hypothetical protein
MHSNDDLQFKIVIVWADYSSKFSHFSNILRQCSADLVPAVKDNLILLKQMRIIEEEGGELVLNVSTFEIQLN